MRFNAASLVLPLAVLPEFLLAGFLIFTHRMPVTHDTFQYFAFQYVFLNNAVCSGEIPLWLPSMTYGSVSTWWFAIQASPLQQIFLQLGPLLRGFDFLSLFHLSILMDSILLATGVWLLARRLFSQWHTTVFITWAVLGSSIWSSQVWFNFHFAYSLPLVIYLLHIFFDTGRWRYALGAGNLLAYQMLGNLPYYLPVISLNLFLYFLLYFLTKGGEFRRSLALIRLDKRAWVALLGMGLSFVLLHLLLRTDVGQLQSYVLGRKPNHKVPLADFLAYGNNQELGKWAEVVLGISPALDFTLYFGLLGLVLAGVSLTQFRGKHLNLFLLVATLLAFSMATPLSTLLWYTWPMMKFYRHLGFVTCFVKLWLCFLAGAGWEALASPAGSVRPSRAVRLLCIVAPILLGVWLIWLSAHPDIVRSWILAIMRDEIWKVSALLQVDVLKAALLRTGYMALCSTVAIVCLTMTQRVRCPGWLLLIALLVHGFDLYSYKLFDLCLKTAPLTEKQSILVQFQNMPFQARRIPLDKSTLPRTQILRDLRWEGDADKGYTLFFQEDEPIPTSRVDYLERPLQRFLKAYLGKDIDDDITERPAGYFLWNSWRLPTYHAAAFKIAGLTEDKIQFFSEAVLSDNERWTASQISDAAYTGDLMFLKPSAPQQPTLTGWLDPTMVAPTVHRRLHLPYRIQHFDCNRLQVHVDAPTSGTAWMLWSTTWHPSWKATINGEPTQIYRANLAFQALPLKPGPNQIQFRFESKRRTALYRLFAINGLLWLLALGV